jgi:hypothetical protein
MFKIKKRKYAFDGTKTTCTLTVGWEDLKIFNEIPCIFMEVENKVMKRFANNLRFHIKDAYSSMNYNFVVRGVAKCDEKTDKYDMEKGKKIAFYNALKKLNKIEWFAAESFKNATARLYCKFDNIFADTEHHCITTFNMYEELIK